MENMNNFQGKRKDQYEKSAKFTGYGILGALLIAILLTLCGCTTTYYVSDAEYDDAKEEHLEITYHNNLIYWGWYDGWWYYYGKPHYYPWYYYYNVRPPSYYNPITHIIVHTLVNKPTHRPNIRVKTNTHRNNKVIIKTNNGSKRTNKTTTQGK